MTDPGLQQEAEQAPVALSEGELAEVKRQSEMQVHHDYIIPRLLATIESRDQRIKELEAIAEAAATLRAEWIPENMEALDAVLDAYQPVALSKEER